MNQTETMSPENTKIQWHPGFYAATEIELRQNRGELEFHREYNLSKKPLQVDLLDFMECVNSFTEPGDRQNADAVLQVSVSANREIYDQVRRRNTIMCEALRELFKDELVDAHEKGKSEGENRLKELYAKLEQDGRREEIFQSLNNPDMLKKLYKEYDME